MINIKIENQKIYASCDEVVSDSVKYLQIKFDFSIEWSGYTKTAVFRSETLESPVSVVLDENSRLYVSDNCFLVPSEVIKSPEFTVSVFGISDDKVITTAEYPIRVKQSGYGNGAAPTEPTPTEYQQLVNISNDTKEIAQSVRDDADNGVFKGDPGEQGIQGIQGVNGEQGIQGLKGDDGADGYTPIKGIDYFTSADIDSLNIPSKTSQLQNDSGFLTQHQDISGKADKATTIAGYGITDAFTKAETYSKLGAISAVKADKASSLAGYGIANAYTKAEVDEKTVVDQSYQSTSVNSQSGKAVAEAILQSVGNINTILSTVVTGGAS